jgi:hypothetical protein
MMNGKRKGRANEATSQAQETALFTATVVDCAANHSWGGIVVQCELRIEGPECHGGAITTCFVLENVEDVELLIREMAAFEVTLAHADQLPAACAKMVGRSAGLRALPGFGGVCGDLALAAKDWKPNTAQRRNRRNDYGFSFEGPITKHGPIRVQA